MAVGALRQRNFRLLFIGQSISALGNSLAAYPVGLAAAGPVAAAAGVRPVLWGTGLIGLAAVLSLLLIPGIRQLTSEVPDHAQPEMPPSAPA